ncbi:maleylpyruvate isomerase [Bosea sp. NPDC003192]|uniref:maleylpyruvate isomerase n=1 Tax=Bosea sp. NPDC003192 TaxID=3390551 RepID=UPI003CFC1B91
MIGSEARRAQLAQRLGPGARFDDAAAPATELGWARLGTAAFARKLNDLTNDELTSRRSASAIVAVVSYEARALAQICEWARSGVCQPESDPFVRILHDVEFATTLPAEALRNLFRHSEVHLNVEWRDLNSVAWDAEIRLPDGSAVRVRDTPRTRALSIWRHAACLHADGGFLDIPPAVVDALLQEAASAWSGTGVFVLLPTDRPNPVSLGHSTSPQVIEGTAADLASWLVGGPPRRLSSSATIPAATGPSDLNEQA